MGKHIVASASTSGEALEAHLVSGRGFTQRERVYDCLMASAVPLSRRQVSQLTGIAINAVCGRVAELIEDHRIRVLDNPVKDEATGMSVQALMPIAPQPLQRKFEWPA